jgi:hypothetical protein
MVEASEFQAFPDAFRFALAVASSSKNAGEFLKRILLDVFAVEWRLPHDFFHEGMTRLNLFGVGISGRDFEHGKPHPMIFLTALQELGFPPDHCSWPGTPPRGAGGRDGRVGSGEAEQSGVVERGWCRPGNNLAQRRGGERSEEGRLDRAIIR